MAIRTKLRAHTRAPLLICTPIEMRASANIYIYICIKLSLTARWYIAVQFTFHLFDMAFNCAAMKRYLTAAHK